MSRGVIPSRGGRTRTERQRGAKAFRVQAAADTTLAQFLLGKQSNGAPFATIRCPLWVISGHW
jgi:hypothetical protein